MMRFERVDEPDEFDERVRKPGRKWLDNNPPPKRPRDYWTPVKPQLADAFRNLCAFSCLHEPVGTVDHFLSCKLERHLAYEWSNYRFAAAWINASKQNVDDGVLDPFEVGDGWFEILLPSLQLVVTDKVPNELREKAQFTIQRLHLVDDERVLRQRSEWYQLYRKNELTLEGLRRLAPLIAAAVDREAARASGILGKNGGE